MIAVGSNYLQIVGPFYGFFGGGLALYLNFASQGAGRVGWAMWVVVPRWVTATACLLRWRLHLLFMALRMPPPSPAAHVSGQLNLNRSRRSCTTLIITQIS